MTTSIPGLTAPTATSSSESIIAKLLAVFGSKIVSSEVRLGDAAIAIRRDGMLEIFKQLRDASEFQFNFFVSITVVDWLDSRPERFEMVYHLLSLPLKHRLRVKIPVPETKPEVDSVVQLWPGANFMEREVWDMYGITLTGHPDLRRILMYEEFKGHPLRKDYPVQGKQPRVKLRMPEVRNTGLDMVRPSLTQISKRRPTAETPAAPGTTSRFVEHKHT